MRNKISSNDLYIRKAHIYRSALSKSSVSYFTTGLASMASDERSVKKKTMNLYTTDARPNDALQQSETAYRATIDLRVLAQIEPELEEFEKVAILFLLSAERPDSYNTLLALCRNTKECPCVISEYLRTNPDVWEKKLVEAFCVIGNYEVLQNLGYADCDKISSAYQARTPRYACNINVAAKVLYKVFESLDGEKTKLLLENVYNEKKIAKPARDVPYLEMHALYWLQERYIAIYPDGTADFGNLLKHLKGMGYYSESIYHDVAHFSEARNRSIGGLDVLDSSSREKISPDVREKFTSRNGAEPRKSTNVQQSTSRVIQKGLCMIINQVYFPPPYKRREGSDSDRDNLRKTFKRMNFDVVIRENLTKDGTRQQLEEASNNFDEKKYDCFVVIILSHGYEGGIVTCDGQEIPIKDIEDAVCNRKLRNVIKLLIIQACQGKNTGDVSEMSDLATDGPEEATSATNDFQESDLATDGPSENISRYKHFSRFMSTMDRFVSIRHKILGSWFIDAVCKEFSKDRPISLSDWSTNVIANVQSREGNVDGSEKASQLPEFSTRQGMTVYFPPYVDDEAI